MTITSIAKWQHKAILINFKEFTQWLQDELKA